MVVVGYVSRGRALLEGFIDNLRLEKLQSEENQYSTIVSQVLPLDQHELERIERRIHSENRQHKCDNASEINRNYEQKDRGGPIGRDGPMECITNDLYKELNEQLKRYAEILTKLLVNPNDQQLRSTLQLFAGENNGILGEISTLTICLLDTWVCSSQHTAYGFTHSSLSDNMPANAFKQNDFSVPFSISDPSNAVTVAKLMDDNKEMKRKIAFYKSQISRFYGQGDREA
ncbi:hypothetical protein BMR1_02g01820 [Babesia microti strain RI]|uniref:Uncharacterized protein n=1 Tax=Babesia microti (strain RI) TaxID=1133968 RepID=I7IGA5_BABMR|nr:hypothetical protein BMR1_02g01820 [Babesia microti strain RI]CCF73521.1 hypothetical protein BMR1_02g01820 [Babesia microti strain RI]|eukprot:XP_012648130.1 hypothetical protein BMR1_02g01820 [Babesia microti strain RI]